METARDYIREHSLKEAMLDENIAQTTRYNVMLWSLRDLVDHIGLKVSVDTFFRAIDDIYHTRRGMIRFEDFCEELKSRTGGDVGRVFERWLNVRHNQYFKIKDLTSYFYPDPISGKFVTGSGWAELEGKVKNCGKEGGFVVVCIKNEEAIQRYSCYLNPWGSQIILYGLLCEMGTECGSNYRYVIQSSEYLYGVEKRNP